MNTAFIISFREKVLSSQLASTTTKPEHIRIINVFVSDPVHNAALLTMGAVELCVNTALHESADPLEHATLQIYNALSQIIGSVHLYENGTGTIRAHAARSTWHSNLEDALCTGEERDLLVALDSPLL